MAVVRHKSAYIDLYPTFESRCMPGNLTGSLPGSLTAGSNPYSELDFRTSVRFVMTLAPPPGQLILAAANTPASPNPLRSPWKDSEWAAAVLRITVKCRSGAIRATIPGNPGVRDF